MSDVPASRMRHPAGDAPPRMLPGFAHINRYWDRARAAWSAKILPGEYYVTLHGEMIATVLGSCVSACMRDPKLGIGGMNHFMLPEGDGSWGGTRLSLATRYGSFAMEHLINDILSQGGEKSRLEVKVFGGGRILASMSDVGLRNIEFVHRFLRDDGLRLVKQDVGDIYPRKLLYDPASGRVLMKKLKGLHNQTIAEREASYRQRIEEQPVAGDVELF